MRTIVIASAMLLALSACGKKQDAAAPDVAGVNSATPMTTLGSGSQPGASPADWTDRWWTTDNPDQNKAAFVDIDGTTPTHGQFEITFKDNVNATGHKADAIATPQGTTLPFVIDGQHKSFAIVIGKDTGVPALAEPAPLRDPQPRQDDLLSGVGGSPQWEQRAAAAQTATRETA